MIVWMRWRERQDVEVVADLRRDLFELLGDLVAPERRQPLQAEIEDGARLLLGELVGAVLGDRVARIGDELDQRLDVLRRPAPLHQALARDLRVLGGADQRDHLVDVGDGDREPDQHMRAVARLAEQEFRAPPDDFLAEGDEAGKDVLQVEQLRAAAVQRHHVHAEARLQRREAVELVQHHVGDGVALQLDHDADAVAVGLRRGCRRCPRCACRGRARPSSPASPPCSPDKGTSVMMIASRSLRTPRNASWRA